MAKKKGTFIVIEGIDGSGKTEQLRRLSARLKRTGRRVSTVHFPRHGKPSAYFVDRYLNGAYGSADKVGPYRTSLFYALDRFEASEKIHAWLKRGDIVLADRYTISNMGHQGSKIPKRSERLKFFAWLHNLEYGILGIPKPDRVVVCNMPAKIAYGLIAKKRRRGYIKNGKRDVHEADRRHLARAEHAYVEAALAFPRDFRIVKCASDGKLLSVEEIHEKVWAAVFGAVANNAH